MTEGVSQLDRAYALRLSGQAEDALRLAASLLTANVEDVGSADLVARLLLDLGRAESAAEVAAQVVLLQTERGDLPAARVAAQTAIDAGAPLEGMLSGIANAFGKGAARIGEVALRPPALPAEVEVAPFYAKLSGTPLLDAAEKAAARFLKTKPSISGALPELPLFGALSPERLLKLLARLELRELPAGQPIVREGEPGHEAFVLVRGVVNVVRGAGETTPTLLATLGPGAIFGEMALVSDAPRAASAFAVEAVELLCVGRKALEQLAGDDPVIGQELGEFCYGRMIANLLRHSAILSGIEPAKRKELVARFTSERFKTGALLLRQGEDSDRMFLIASGLVQVRTKDADGDRVVLAELGPGEVAGEISLVLRRPANATVVALHPTVALVLSREQFQESIREHPTLLRELYDIAVQRDEETRNVLAQKAVDVTDSVLI